MKGRADTDRPLGLKLEGRVLDRQVRKIDSKVEDGEVALFSAFRAAKNIVLLGDPGAGKSELFRSEAVATGGLFLTVRELLNTPAGDIPAERILWIDALDETKGGKGDSSSIDQLTRRLAELSPCGMRLSCRAVDWLDKSDLAALKPYLQKGGELVVLQLLPLTNSEQAQVLINRGFTRVEGFLEEARRRELTNLLGNAQTLLMLASVAGHGDWPASRTELFHRAALLLLDETNEEHVEGTRGVGYIPASELLDAAGALCALRLISHCSGFTWRSRALAGDIPTFKEVKLCSQAHLDACLKRRVFVISGPGTMDYVHRTVAEYLAALWMVKLVGEGLSIGRLLAVMRVQDRPATSLRGLVAWLTSLLPSPSTLLRLDPVGLLMYGDLSQWTPPMKMQLLDVLIAESEQDPWFYRQRELPVSAQAMADRGLLERYRSLLLGSDTETSIKLLILAILKDTRLMAGLGDALEVLIRDGAQPLIVRIDAIQALHEGAESDQALLPSIYAALGCSGADLRLRCILLRARFGHEFEIKDLIALLADLHATMEDIAIGTTYGLSDVITPSDAARVLNQLSLQNERRGATRRSEREFARVYGEIFARALSSDPGLNATFDWYSNYQMLIAGRSIDGVVAKELRAGDGLRLRLVLRAVLRSLSSNEQVASSWYRFMQMLGSAIPSAMLFEEIESEMLLAREVHRDDIYKVALQQAMALDACPFETFWRLYAFADSEPALVPVRSALCSSLVEDWRSERLMIEQQEIEEGERWRQAVSARVSSRLGQVSSGEDVALLEDLAEIYFGEELPFSLLEVDSPRERLELVLGKLNAQAALSGFAQVIQGSVFPSIRELVAGSSNYSASRWKAVLAALNESWGREAQIDTFSDSLWSTSLALEALFPIWVDNRSNSSSWEHSWIEPLLHAKRGLAIGTYESLLMAELAAGIDLPSGVIALDRQELDGADRGSTILRVLEAYPQMADRTLLRLFSLAKRDGCWDQLSPIARQTIDTLLPQARNGVDQAAARVAPWLWCGFSIDPEAYRDVLVSLCGDLQEAVMWQILEEGVDARLGSQRVWSYSLSQLAFVVPWVASRYPNIPHPVGGSVGTRNPWDASAMIQSIIAQIGASPRPEAGTVLATFATASSLQSYRSSILHSLANHKTVLADARYEMPTWEKAMETLRNGAPSSAQDLHEVVFSHLEYIAQLLSTRNDDPYKQFWNTESGGKIDTPKVEEIARNSLLGLLRPLLLPHGLRAEPEGHMSADKRVDIVVYGSNIKALIEIKRDFHGEVWTAASEQLHRLYSVDPEADGFGIYLVFWYGQKRKYAQPLPPNGKVRPASAKEMQLMLEDGLPSHLRASTKVLVMDVTGGRG